MFQKMIRRWRDRDNPLLSLLGKVPLFHSLNFDELRDVMNLLQIKRYAIGDVVFRQGDMGQGVYIVISGQIDIFQTEEGKKVVLAQSEAGAFFGETALLDDEPRTGSAVVSLEAELALFSRSSLLLLAEQRPHLSVKIALQLSQVIAERLRRTNRGLREVRDKLEAAQQVQKERT